jgi:Na+-translocating ferredoxin:NAD+ oxidoreductase RnfG subunit/ferredoxin
MDHVRPMRRWGREMRISRTVLWVGLWALGCLLLVTPSFASAQIRQTVDAEMIQSVMPAADSFSAKAGLPPVYTAYGTDADGSPGSVIGYVYLTANVPPFQYGYSSRIDVLVGIDLVGRLTGMHVVNYRESLTSSHGDFLRGPGLQEQVVGKHIGESFQVGRDLDGVSGASISARAMFRGVRNSARRVALAHLQPDESTARVTAGALEDLTWLQLISTGFIRRMSIERFNAEGLDLFFAYIGDEALGGLLMGLVRYQDVSERVYGLVGDDHVMFVGIDGGAVAGFRSNGLSIGQEGEVYPVPSRLVTFLGTPYEGKAAGQVQYTLIMRMDDAVDLEQPFTVVYDDGANAPSTTEYAVPEEVLAAVRERAAAAELVAAERDAAEPGAEEAAAAGSNAVGLAAVGSAVVEPAVSADGSSPSRDVLGSVPLRAGAIDSASAESVESEALAAEPVAPEAVAAAASDASSPPPGLTVPEGTLDLSLDGPPQGIPELDFSNFEDLEDETALSRLLLETRWAPVIRLVLLLGLVLYAFFAKSARVGGVTLGVTLIYLGFFDGGFLSVSHITSGIIVGPGVYLRDMVLLFMVGFTVVTTLLFGRVFCGFLCPFGALQDFITRIVPVRLRRSLPQRIHDRAIYVKYGILLLIVGLAAAPAQVSVYQYFEPFGTVFYLSSSPLLWSIAGGFLVASAVVPRFYCRYACPLGAALGVASFLSIFRIRRVEQCHPCKVCEHACPTGAIRGPEIDFKECVRCNICETKLLTKAGVCRHSLEFVQARLVRLKTTAR